MQVDYYYVRSQESYFVPHLERQCAAAPPWAILPDDTAARMAMNPEHLRTAVRNQLKERSLQERNIVAVTRRPLVIPADREYMSRDGHAGQNATTDMLQFTVPMDVDDNTDVQQEVTDATGAPSSSTGTSSATAAAINAAAAASAARPQSAGKSSVDCYFEQLMYLSAFSLDCTELFSVHATACACSSWYDSASIRLVKCIDAIDFMLRSDMLLQHRQHLRMRWLLRLQLRVLAQRRS